MTIATSVPAAFCPADSERLSNDSRSWHGGCGGSRPGQPRAVSSLGGIIFELPKSWNTVGNCVDFRRKCHGIDILPREKRAKESPLVQCQRNNPLPDLENLVTSSSLIDLPATCAERF